MSGILLIPAVGDPFGLLKPGKCGATMPTACVHPGGSRWAIAGTHKKGDGSLVGLVLAWDGEPVPEGCDRAVRVYNAIPVDTAVRMWAFYDLAMAEYIARACIKRLGGEAVIL